MFFGTLPNKDNLPRSILNFYNNLEEKAQIYLSSFHRLLNTTHNNDEKIIHFIKKTPDILILIKLSFIDEKLQTWCTDPRLSIFWDAVWQASHPIDQQALSQKDQFHGRRPQKWISSYQLMCGITIYHEACQLLNHGLQQESVEVMNLIYQSCHLGCFDALTFYSEINCDKLFAGQIEVPEKILTPIFNAIQWHGTPAFLLCASAYFDIGRYYFTLQNKNECLMAMVNSLAYLHLAEMFENISSDALSNNYYGQGIKESNRWNIPTIAQLRSQLIKYAGLNTLSQERALFAAKQKARQYHATFSTNDNVKPYHI